MKKLVFLLVLLSFTVIFSACPPLQEDDTGGSYGDVLVYEDPLDSYKWFEILDKIAKGGKYVSLDLSKCTYKPDNESGGLIKNPDDPLSPIFFDPFPASASGKDFIVSIILPEAAQIIKEAKPTIDADDKIDDEVFIENAKKQAAFRSFTHLRSIQADNVLHVGNFAFADCKELTEVILPRVSSTGTLADIDIYAFLGCTGLKKIKFNSAEDIGEYAFKDCTNLTELDFPQVWRIEKNAFEGCKSLVSIFFEKVTIIGDEAFKNCTSLKRAEFNVKPMSPGVPPDFTAPGYSGLDRSVIFYPSAFTGCKALEVLNVRNAWNVYFAKDVFANTGNALEIYLLDVPDDDGTSFGHPQNEKFLGNDVTTTVKRINIIVPIVQSLPDNSIIFGNKVPENIVNYIKQNYPNLIEINTIRR